MSQENHDKLLFTSYQYDFILRKIAVLKVIIDNQASVIDIIQGTDGLEFKDESALISGLKAEIHFSKYHALESMFAMVFALIKQPDDVWVWLTTYTFRDFNRMISDMAKSNISAISGISETETIRNLFFKNCPVEFVEQAETKESMQNISRILTLCAKEMTDKDEYNSYKHGLRILSGNLELKLANEKEAIDEVPAFVYLSAKKNKTVKTIPKLYSYERSYKIIKVSSQLTSLMIKQRKLEYSENIIGTLETVDFRNIDVEDIFVYPPNFYTFNEIYQKTNRLNF